MWRHLKDNHGLHPIWPAIISAVVVVLIVFIGILMLWSDNPILADIIAEWKAFTSWLQRIFKPAQYNPL